MTRGPATSSALYRVALFVALVDAVGLGVVMPLVPFLVLHFGGPPALVTQTLALYSLAALAGALLIGRWGDRYGHGPVFLATLLGTAIATGGILASWSLVGLFAFRTLTGFLTGRVAVLRALVIREASAPLQADRIAGLSAATVLGIALGPAVPGFVGLFVATEHSIWIVTLALSIAATVAALIVAAIALGRAGRAQGAGPQPGPAQAPTPFRALVQTHRTQLWIAGLLNYGQGVVLSVTALFVASRFGWGAAATGWLLSGVAGGIAAARLALYPAAVGRLGLEGMMRWCTIAAIPFLIIAGLSRNEVPFVLATLAFSVLASLANVVPPALIAARARDSEAGAAQGVCAAFGTMGLFAGASLSGPAFQFLGAGAPYWLGAAVLLCALKLQWWRYLPNSEIA